MTPNPAPSGSLRSGFILLLGPLALMWVVEIADFLVPVLHLDRFGIRPREVVGLAGIVLAPFLHGGFGHLAANSVPFLVLGGLVLLGGRGLFLALSTWVVVVGGAGVWLLGASGTSHIGASLVIFGYLGFLLGRGLFERRAGGILVAIILLGTYGGVLHGLFPGQPGVSWLGHLCGFLSGGLASWALGGGKREG